MNPKGIGGLLLFFGPIVLLVGLTTNDAIGWLATGISMTLFGVICLIVSKFVK